MARIILFVMLMAGILLAIAVMVAALRALSVSDDTGGDAQGLPAPVKAVSYTFLMVLLLGVTTGMVGAD